MKRFLRTRLIFLKIRLSFSFPVQTCKCATCASNPLISPSPLLFLCALLVWFVWVCRPRLFLSFSINRRSFFWLSGSRASDWIVAQVVFVALTALMVDPIEIFALPILSRSSDRASGLRLLNAPSTLELHLFTLSTARLSQIGPLCRGLRRANRGSSIWPYWQYCSLMLYFEHCFAEHKKISTMES